MQQATITKADGTVVVKTARRIYFEESKAIRFYKNDENCYHNAYAVYLLLPGDHAIIENMEE
jgi:CRISPR/Cas system-associated endoribonuclease Cas2